MTMTVKEQVQKAVRLKDAYDRWTAAAKSPDAWRHLDTVEIGWKGCPIRTAAEIERIYKICSACPQFIAGRKPHSGNCKLCGCRLNISEQKSFNKIKWATESCPDVPPRWMTQIVLPTNSQAMTPIVQEKQTMKTQTIPELPVKLSPRQERAAVRAARVAARQARMAKRAAEEAKKPQLISLPGNDDPLMITDQNGNSVGHVLRNRWAPCAGFLVGGGPSLKSLDLSPLKERGIVSLAINNVAAMAPVRAFCCGDPPEKFHHGIWFDPAMRKFVPERRLSTRVRAKLPSGEFAFTSLRVKDCPEVWGYKRDSVWDAANFLKREAATWGRGDKQAKEEAKPHILFSFFIGLRLIHYLGCRRVYLIGVDFGMDQEHGYAFEQARTEGAIRGNNNSYRIAAGMCLELRPHFEAASFEVFNCNRHSKLTAWPYVPFEEAVEDCRGLVPKEPLDCSFWYEKPGDKDEETRTEAEK